MAVVGAEELSTLNIFDFTETAQLTPGVDLFPSVQAAAIRLRGVGPGSFALTSPQSVAVFIDDIAQGSVGAAFATLVDIERIELLRGPQGTLYGQNAPGGAYNISTRAPNASEFEGYIEGSYSQFDSSDKETVDIRGAVNLPIVEDVLGVRLAGVYADSDGFVKVENPVSGEDTTGGKEHEALRARFLWLIDDTSDLTWTSNYQDLDDNHAISFNVQGIVPGTGGDNPLPAIENRFDDRKWYGDFLSAQETDLWDTSFHYRKDLGFTNLDLLASYQEFDTFQLDNRQPYPGRNNRFQIQLDWDTRTTELRFSDTGEKLDYIAGLYYTLRELDGFFDVNLGSTTLLGPAGGQGDVKSAFVNLTWHLTEKWDLTTGVRYDKNDVETQSNFEFLGFNAVVDGKEDWEHPSWSIKLRHFITPQSTAYLAVDHAYKQGGFNNLIPGLLTLETFFPELGPVAEDMLQFDEEISTAYEIGIKGTTLESRFNYNFAIFYQEFEDHQITQPGAVEALMTPLGDLNALFANQLANAEEVVTRGVEAELFYLIGETWDAGLRLSYFDATVEEWSNRFCGAGEEDSPDQLYCPSESGDALNSLPPLSANFQLGHTRALSPEWGFYGRLNWTWYSDPNSGIEFEQFKTDKSLVGLTLGLQSVASGVDIRFWGKNLTDTDRNVDPTLRTDGDPSLPQPFNGRYYQGREYGLTLSYNF